MCSVFQRVSTFDQPTAVEKTGQFPSDLEAITFSALRLDEPLRQLSPKPLYVDSYPVGLRVMLKAPYLGEQAYGGDDASGLFGQDPQNFKLEIGEINGLTVERRGFGAPFKQKSLDLDA